MRITEFMNRFPTEESCQIYFKEFRIKQGGFKQIIFVEP